VVDDDAGEPSRLVLAHRGGDVWASQVTVRGTASGCEQVVVRVGGREMSAAAGRFELRAPLAAGTNEVVAECGDAKAERTFERRGAAADVSPAPQAVVDSRPRWVDQAVVYGVIPRNFGETGGFRDVSARLDDLAELGVSAIWLSPINRTIDGDFGYAVTDYFRLRPEYGSEADFRELVQEAHRRDIRVLMDFVPNHTSVEHPYHRDASTYGRSSRHWDFYDREPDGTITHYFDWTHLPNLNYENPEVRRMMLDAFAHWVRDFDVDGFRVDVAWGVKQRAPGFWPEWRAHLKAIKPDLLLLAEASARDPYYFENGFDAAYDWTEELGHWAWEGVWDAETPGDLVAALHGAVTNYGEGYHPDRLVFRFLNNNDTGASFVGRHGTDLTRVAAAALLTLPGIPLVYTGEEVGEIFSPYEDTAPLVWRDRFGLRDHYRKLIALRKRLPGLHGPGFQRLRAPGAPGVYAYVRTAAAGRDPTLVVLNFAGEPARVRLQLPPALRGSWRDELGGGSVRSGSIPVDAYGARVLTREDAA
jgi:glycosidase